MSEAKKNVLRTHTSASSSKMLYECVVTSFDVTLGDLMGTIQEFFKKLGMDELKFKPTYNPYTEHGDLQLP